MQYRQTHSALVLFLILILTICPKFSHAAPGSRAPLYSRDHAVSFPNALPRVKSALSRVTEILRNFEPQGVHARDIRVLDEGPRRLPRIEFEGQRTLAFAPIPFHFSGDIVQQSIECPAPYEAQGFELTMVLSDSSPIIARTAERVSAQLCFQTGESTILNVKAFRTEGSSYNRVLGPEVDRTLAEQIPALIESLFKVTHRTP